MIAITAGHRTKSERFSQVIGHVYCCSDKMSDQVRGDAEATQKSYHRSVLKNNSRQVDYGK